MCIKSVRIVIKKMSEKLFKAIKGKGLIFGLFLEIFMLPQTFQAIIAIWADTTRSLLTINGRWVMPLTPLNLIR